MFDITPANGHRLIMDGMPGLIHSGDDFGINAAGIVITETTISGFHGFDPKGVPEFVRARKAMQYSSSIDDFARLMTEGNNGGYANDWLVADRNTNEIASLELGLKNVNLKRTKDGYFVGANFPIDPKLAAEETDFDLANGSLSPNARRVRGEAFMQENRGKFDVASGEKYLSDHYDSFDKKEKPSERTLCGHIDLVAAGLQAVAARVRARRGRAGQGDRCRFGVHHVALRLLRPRLRHRIQGRPAHRRAPRVRVAEAALAGLAVSALDAVRGCEITDQLFSVYAK